VAVANELQVQLRPDAYAGPTKPRHVSEPLLANSNTKDHENIETTSPAQLSPLGVSNLTKTVLFSPIKGVSVDRFVHLTQAILAAGAPFQLPPLFGHRLQRCIES
jgi:hypothetical protein